MEFAVANAVVLQQVEENINFWGNSIINYWLFLGSPFYSDVQQSYATLPNADIPFSHKYSIMQCSRGIHSSFLPKGTTVFVFKYIQNV